MPLYFILFVNLALSHVHAQPFNIRGKNDILQPKCVISGFHIFSADSKSGRESAENIWDFGLRLVMLLEEKINCCDLTHYNLIVGSNIHVAKFEYLNIGHMHIAC